MQYTRLNPFTYVKEKQSDHISDMHRHPTLEILFVQSGSIILEVFTTEKEVEIATETTVKAGQLVYIPPECKHRQQIHTLTEYLVIELGIKNNTKSVADILASEALTKNLNNLNRIVRQHDVTILTDSVNVGATLSGLISLLHDNHLDKNDPYFDLEYYLLLNELFLRTCQCVDFSEKLQYSNVHSRNALSFIETNYATQISVSQIAKHVGITTVRLNQILQEDFNASAWELVMKKRMALAEKLITSTNFSISKIAAKCGYSSLRAFRTAFNKTHSQSPTDFRKTNTHVFHYYVDPISATGLELSSPILSNTIR